MTLPASFPLSMSDVATELGESLPLSLEDPIVRNLAGVEAGPISFSDLLGKSAPEPVQGTNAEFLGVFEDVSNAPLGDAEAGRLIVCVLHGQGGVSSASINGVSATIHETATATSSVTVVITFISAVVPTGTSGEILVNGSDPGGSTAIWRLVGLESTTPHDTASEGLAQQAVTIELDIPSNGILIAGISVGGGAAPNMSGVTKRYTLGGHDEGLSAATDHAVSGGSSGGGLLAVNTIVGGTWQAAS